MKKLILASILVFISAGVVMYLKIPLQNNSIPSNSTQPVAGSYLNATYIIENESVKLINGHNETPIPDSSNVMATDVFGNEAQGDLNGDGQPDMAFLLTQNGGGTGTFFYVAVALKMANGYQGTNAVYIGDRIAPQTTEIKNGELIVNYADRKPGEPFSADPSLGISKYLKVTNGQLVEKL
jgi:hypothetical protein